jgi:hypothetical protein
MQGTEEVCVFDPCCSIRSEVYQACLKLGADADEAQQICFADTPGDIYRACARLGAGAELLSILGSYGDTLDDSDVLTFLKAYNAGKAAIVHVVCRVDAE